MFDVSSLIHGYLEENGIGLLLEENGNGGKWTVEENGN